MGVLGAHEGRPPPHSGGYTRVPPVLPGPRRDRDAPWGFWGLTERSLPHTAAVTPESLRSCLGRGVIGTPRGGLGAHEGLPPPHSGGYTRVPPVLPGPRRDRDAPWGFGAHGEVPPPHSGGYTRVPPVLPGPRRDRDAPWGFWGRTERSLPHTAAVTPESLRSCLGRGVIGTPRGGFGGARRGPSPTQRRLHPSPSGPAWAAEG